MQFLGLWNIPLLSSINCPSCSVFNRSIWWPMYCQTCIQRIICADLGVAVQFFEVQQLITHPLEVSHTFLQTRVLVGMHLTARACKLQSWSTTVCECFPCSTIVTASLPKQLATFTLGLKLVVKKELISSSRYTCFEGLKCLNRCFLSLFSSAQHNLQDQSLCLVGQAKVRC